MENWILWALLSASFMGLVSVFDTRLRRRIDRQHRDEMHRQRQLRREARERMLRVVARYRSRRSLGDERCPACEAPITVKLMTPCNSMRVPLLESRCTCELCRWVFTVREDPEFEAMRDEA